MVIAGDEGRGLHVRLVGIVCFTYNFLLTILAHWKLRWIAHARDHSGTSNHSQML